MGLDQYLYTSKSENPEEKIEDERALAQWRKAYFIDEYLRNVGRNIAFERYFYIERSSLEKLLQVCLAFYTHAPVRNSLFEELLAEHQLDADDYEIQGTIEQLIKVLHENPKEFTFIYLSED